MITMNTDAGTMTLVIMLLIVMVLWLASRVGE